MANDTFGDNEELLLLLERLQEHESLELEFKTARGGLPRGLWETVSAFANTHGGWVILGIAEERQQTIIEGVKNPQQLMQQFFDLIQNTQKLSYPVCGSNDIRIDHVDGRDLVTIRIPPAPRKTKPIYIGQNPYGGTYVRRHSGDYHCAKPEVDRMMREAADIGADAAVLRRFDWADLDVHMFKGYRRRYQTWNPDSPWNTYSDQDFLTVLGGYRLDRETGEEGITIAGLLMFGTPLAIRDWRGRHLIDYRQYQTHDKEQWDDRLVWEGNLLGAFDAIYPRLIRDQPVPFRLENGVRVGEGPIQTALREALINCLVHADYGEQQATLIVHDTEGFFLRNPGLSRVPEPDMLLGAHSDPRNPTLVSMFRHIGLAEEAGTGVPRILAAWHRAGFREPSFAIDSERYEFVAQLRLAHLLSQEDRQWLQALGDHWTEAEQLALVIARHAETVDNLSLRRLTGQHPADTTKVLSSLRQREFLAVIKYGSKASYRLGPRALISEGAEMSMGDLSTSMGDLHPNSGDLRVDSGDLSANSGDLIEISPKLSRELEELAEKARQQRNLDISEREQIIVLLCSKAPLSARELALLLNRRADYVHKIVQPLIAKGRLGYFYPDNPNHPRQRYVAVTAEA